MTERHSDHQALRHRLDGQGRVPTIGLHSWTCKETTSLAQLPPRRPNRTTEPMQISILCWAVKVAIVR